jgi:hypothetical protein
MNKLNVNSKLRIKYCAGVLAFTFFSVGAVEASIMNDRTLLSFEMAVQLAQKNDPWLTGNIHKQKAVESLSTAVNSLPDPKVSISFANLPANGWSFSQEAMTQTKVGISQVFPRGDSLSIKGQQLKIESEAFPFQRKDREAKVAVTVGSLWLEAYRIQQSITLIENSRLMFEKLFDITTANYASASGKTRQQDIVLAQLELIGLDDRLNKLIQEKKHYEGMLLQWIATLPSGNSSTKESSLISSFSIQGLALNNELPKIALISRDFIFNNKGIETAKLLDSLSSHPSILAIKKQVYAGKVGVDLAKQKYKPEWGISASYGHRSDDPMGKSRADLFTLGVTFDLPVFTENSQDKEVQSAIFQTEAVKTEKLLLLRQLLGSFSSAKGRLLALIDRQTLYTTKLLPKMHDQAEILLIAYTTDDGDFAEVVRSRIAVLNTEIDELLLTVDEQKIRLELNYLFINSRNTSVINNKENNMNLTNSRRYTAISGEK